MIADNFIKKALTISANVGCGFEGDSKDAKSILNLITDLESRIAELEEKQRWRVVADGELPEVYRDEDGDFIPFLVCEGDGDYPFTARYDGINWRAGIFVPDITHWMPLPTPPEVQE